MKKEPVANLREGLSKSTMALQAIEHLRKQLHNESHSAHVGAGCDHCARLWKQISTIQKAMENTR